MELKGAPIYLQVHVDVEPDVTPVGTPAACLSVIETPQHTFPTIFRTCSCTFQVYHLSSAPLILSMQLCCTLSLFMFKNPTHKHLHCILCLHPKMRFEGAAYKLQQARLAAACSDLGIHCKHSSGSARFLAFRNILGDSSSAFHSSHTLQAPCADVWRVASPRVGSMGYTAYRGPCKRCNSGMPLNMVLTWLCRVRLILALHG